MSSVVCLLCERVEKSPQISPQLSAYLLRLRESVFALNYLLAFDKETLDTLTPHLHE